MEGTDQTRRRRVRWAVRGALALAALAILLGGMFNVLIALFEGTVPENAGVGFWAVFLLRSKYGAGYNPPGVGGGTGFTDVPSTYWAAAWIKQLVAEGITAGCSAGSYCPESPVTRAQMAVFLVRTFGLATP